MTEARWTTARTESAGSAPHLSFIDALRGLAFLTVMFVHVREVGPLPAALAGLGSAANYGVQLFFVASALTLFMSFESRAKVDQRPLLAFLVRRLFRIAPLFWLAIPTYVLISGVEPREMAPLGIHLPQVAATALFVHGWFPASINAVVPGGWSIAVEMNFYLLLPLAYRTLTNLRRAVIACVVAFAGSIAVSTLVRRWLAGSWSPVVVANFTYYWLPRQLPVFLLGIVLFHLVRRRNTWGLASRVPPDAIAALVVLMALVGSRLPVAYFWFSCGFAWLAFSLSRRPSRLLVNGVTRYVGKVSYSAYITHFLVLDLLRRFHLDSWSAGTSSAGAVIKFAVMYLWCGVGTLALSTLCHRLIEVPGQNLGRFLIKRFNLGSPPPVDTDHPAPALSSAPGWQSAP